MELDKNLFNLSLIRQQFSCFQFFTICKWEYNEYSQWIWAYYKYICKVYLYLLK